MEDNPRFEWPTIADPSDKSAVESRRRFQQVFGEAFAARTSQWMAQVLHETPLQILVLFHDASGMPYPPEVHFSAMCIRQDVESNTVFLPWR
jgi:3-deoxy-D-arabino-heptulosonate 7-phosphate (DAHP) synthase